MVEIATIATFLIAALASLFMAWAIGAGSSGSTPFAPAVGANAISVMRAGFFVGILGFSGAVLQGANVSEAVGTELIGGVVLSPSAATIALIIAAALVAIGVFAGYPIATAFTVTGAVVGVGLAMGGTPAWPKYIEIATLWILTPFVGGGLAYTIARLLRSEPISETYLIVGLAAFVGVLVANIEFAILGPAEAGGASIAQASSGWVPGPDLAGVVVVTAIIAVLWGGAVGFDLRGDVERGERHFLLVLGALVAFSAGGSQVGLAIGPLIPLSDDVGLPLIALLLGGGFGLLLGSWTGAPRMIKAIAQDYSSLGPRRSIAALIPSFMIAQAAVLFGIPVSFNEIIVSAIIGSGYAAAEAGGGVSARKMGYTVLAWIISLAGSVLIAYGGYTILDVLLL
ncbi:transport protein (probable substrate phosphate/sulfate) [Natrialba magadii ATCC 43099]|uniref:Phosphate transporter n=1 Tax=Natrialba magadii (strain ATCC 43099 / DSM 3394 / CCM 3739 / CIP 104546 / IAM 13178 / JCM 8861 / NBRC 102185 / NCIMB 2190 / MS3) TaxID=547559 RepID=D3SUN3_NATMM|nr:inorganic phosphate transporter [Natrialba magadii]ADD05291.1 transport protein (probable substrate phosphate/sulfate) [Natrialba magadii ATCC 43099]ELY29160.1 phosphate transporter [Natrialba magadii ATCC 43099]